MLLRLGIAGVLIALGFLAFCVHRCILLRQARQTATIDPLFEGAIDGIPLILYFTAANCAPCIYQQKPALHQLLNELGDRVQVVEVDAVLNPDAADRWRVQTVPTAFLLDAQRAALHVNHGVVNSRKLREQLLPVISS